MIPDFPVAYIIFDDSEVFYVGATKSLFNRWNAHLNNPTLGDVVKRKGVKVAWIAVKIAQLGDLEGALIRFLNPSLNAKRNGRVFYYHADIVRPSRTRTYERLIRQ